MSYADDHWEYHLTPTGWIKGSYRGGLGDGEDIVDPPADRVLTIECQRKQSSYWSSNANYSENEIWNCGDKNRISELKEKFGDRPPWAGNPN